ncbi:hypothetical protein TNCT_151161 [Trichonephila clavata]|uniref:Uncharacterized protein n=1 Tax=Trichonephila clavata TaxID=2740835 RepID=A0A8X6H878_TRICU|nr:hypothetical protein TNCT_151161 [Trichonephila clavata]
MKGGFVAKPNHILIRILYVDPVDNSVHETQPLFHGPGAYYLTSLNLLELGRNFPLSRSRAVIVRIVGRRKRYTLWHAVP